MKTGGFWYFSDQFGPKTLCEALIGAQLLCFKSFLVSTWPRLQSISIANAGPWVELPRAAQLVAKGPPPAT